MSIASNVIEENTRLATCMTLMQEKLDLNNKTRYADDDLHTLIERFKCYYVDPCKTDRRSLYESNSYINSTYSNEGYYSLKQARSSCFGYFNLKNIYFPEECIIELECYLDSIKTKNTQLRVGLYNENNGNKGVIGNIYSDDTVEIRFGKACGTYTEYWTDIATAASPSISQGVWYKIRLIIKTSTVSFELFDNLGSSIVAINCEMNSGVLGDSNRLCIERCYDYGTLMRIRNIKVYDVGYLE